MAYFRKRLSYWLEHLIALVLPFIIRSALKKGLHAIWLKGDLKNLPKEGIILAPNHHSWWDVYLAWYVHKLLNRQASALMDEAQLGRFRFFRQIGIISRKEVREAIRRLKRGDVFFVFPEGELRQAGKVETLERGVFFLAKQTDVKLYPLAFRVLMRGAEHPEAFIVLGERLELSGDEAKDSAQLKAALNSLLEDIETCVKTIGPEKEPEGFEKGLGGQKSTSERTAWLARFWL